MSSAENTYEIRLPDYTGFSVQTGLTASKARYAHWLKLSDVVPVRLIDLQVRRHLAHTWEPTVFGGTDGWRCACGAIQ